MTLVEQRRVKFMPFSVPRKSIEDMRPTMDFHFLSMAALSAKRSACVRRAVGAVIVGPNKFLISEGWNGVMPKERECMDGGCPRAKSDVEPGSSYDTGPGACVALHAEENALVHRAGNVSVVGATIYIVCLKRFQNDRGFWEFGLHDQQGPCGGCARLLTHAGIKEIVTP